MINTTDSNTYQVVDNYDAVITSPKSLKIFYSNTRSIVKPGRFDELQCVLKALKVKLNIIIFTETWIKSEDEAKRLQIPGYTHYYSYRSNGRGGGVSIFAHNDLKHNFVEEKCLANSHFLWIHLENYSLDIGAIYRKPDTNIAEFLDEYSNQIRSKKRGLTIGDLNFNILNSDCSVILYKETLEENGYKLINKIDKKFCTRETKTTKSILDHACSNLKNTYFHLTFIETPMSDHKHLYLEIKKHKPAPLRKLQYESINYDKLYKMMKEGQNNNTEFVFNLLEERLLHCIKKTKELKTKIQNPPRQDWINKKITDQINSRNILWKQYKINSKDKIKEELFINKRNDVAGQIQKTKKLYYYKAFNDCKKKPAKMWKLINNLSNNRVKENTGPNKLKTLNGYITEEKEICNCFNDFFAEIGSTLASLITKNRIVNSRIVTNETNNLLTLTNYNLCSTDEIARIIKNLKTNTSSGLDGITTKCIKSLKNIIIQELTECVNKCLTLGTFPDSLKIAKVTPIYKSGNKSDPGNYRPISVLPVLSKIFEKVLYKRLKDHIDVLNLINDTQYGFRPKSNTLSATVDLVTNIKLNIDKKKIALGIFIDLKKAFDTVSHDILLQKLNDIGIVGTAHDMFTSYLRNRCQVVKIGKSESSYSTLTYGIPQGSILGPLLFIIYINGINQIGLKGDITLYADDTCLFYFSNTIEEIIDNAQKDLKLLDEWFQTNLLTINVSKTNYIIFASKNKKIQDFPPLTLNNQAIKRTNQEKYLGLVLDHQLTWKPHLIKIKSKLSSLTGALRGIVRCLPLQVRYTIYNSLVKPHIDYLIEIWGTSYKTNLKLLQIAQNKLVKTLFHYDYMTPTDKIYKETKLLNIPQTYIYNTCVLIRKILNKDIHTQIVFTKKHQIQQKRLRNANDINLYSPRTNYGKKNLMHEGAQIYNKLPRDIKESKSLKTFKKLLKYYIKNNKSTNI